MNISNFLNWAQDMQRNPSTEYIDEAGMAKLGRMSKVKQNDPSWQDKIKKEAKKQELKQKFRASQKVAGANLEQATQSTLIQNAKQAKIKSVTAQMRRNKEGKAEARRKNREERSTNPEAREAHKRGEKPRFQYGSGGVVDTEKNKPPSNDLASLSKSAEASGEVQGDVSDSQPKEPGGFKKAWAKARTSSAVGNMQAGGTNPYKDGIGVGDVSTYIGAGGANAGGGASIQKRAALRQARRQKRDAESIESIRKKPNTGESIATGHAAHTRQQDRLRGFGAWAKARNTSMT